MNSIIEVKDVTFTYSGAQRHALERVSLVVAEGEFVVPHQSTADVRLAAVVGGAGTFPYLAVLPVQRMAPPEQIVVILLHPISFPFALPA